MEELRSVPIEFLNLNELEITTGNHANMELRGFNLSSEITAGAAGSAELAMEMKKRVSAANAGLKDPIDGTKKKPYGFHLKFCTSSYKDAGQLRARFRRRGEATLRPYEILTDDDTLLFGVLYTTTEKFEDEILEISEELDIDTSWMHWDGLKSRIEMPLSVSEDIADIVDKPVAAVEVHPTHERLEVSLIWLNENRPL